jgi:ribonuclease HI
MSKSKKSYYVVVRGRRPGLYRKWVGEDGAADQVEGLPGAIFKGFYTLDEAQRWLSEMHGVDDILAEIDLLTADPAESHQRIDWRPDLEEGKVVIFTDGGASPNPGPGGYGVVFLFKELSGGFRLTTNNRMEIVACIEGLRTLKHSCSVVVYSDSRYLVDAMTQGWPQRWRAKGWRRRRNERAENPDLWKQMLELCEEHDVEFRWVRGHAGLIPNERCDQLATQSTAGPDLPEDAGYERPAPETQSQPTLFS